VPFNRPTLVELQEQAEADLTGRLGLGALLRRGILRALARMLAGLVHLLHGHLAWISRQALPDTADAEELERWAGLYGLARKVSQRASGSVEFTGSDGATIPSGTKLRRSDSVEFETTEDGTIASGTATVLVEAVLAGSAGDTTAGADTLQLSPALAGVALDVEVLAPGLLGGTDAETDEELRERLVERLRAGARGGSAADYETWALEVGGVSRAWALPLLNGPGTVGVTFFVSSGSTPPIPDAGQVADVQAYIDARRPVTAIVEVFAPGQATVDVTLSVTPDTTAVRNAVQAALVELFDREAAPGATILLSHLNEAVSSAAGETDHAITVPAADVTVAAGSIAILGTLTFT
jgi:uncharacterized phage protein gp47/JayE